jgi:hypothetical protein
LQLHGSRKAVLVAETVKGVPILKQDVMCNAVNCGHKADKYGHHARLCKGMGGMKTACHKELAQSHAGTVTERQQMQGRGYQVRLEPNVVGSGFPTIPGQEESGKLRRGDVAVIESASPHPVPEVTTIFDWSSRAPYRGIHTPENETRYGPNGKGDPKGKYLMLGIKEKGDCYADFGSDFVKEHLRTTVVESPGLFGAAVKGVCQSEATLQAQAVQLRRRRLARAAEYNYVGLLNTNASAVRSSVLQRSNSGANNEDEDEEDGAANGRGRAAEEANNNNSSSSSTGGYNGLAAAVPRSGWQQQQQQVQLRK